MASAQSNSPQAWKLYEPSDTAPWNLRRVVHLHRRAGFVPTWRETQRDLADGPAKAVERLLAGTARMDGIPAKFEELSTRIGDAAVIANDADRLKAWWMFRMLFS